MTDTYPIQLETDRLILRPTSAEDWPFARDFLMCEDTMRHLGGYQQESDAWRTLAQWIGLWSLTDAAMFGVVEEPVDHVARGSHSFAALVDRPHGCS